MMHSLIAKRRQFRTRVRPLLFFCLALMFASLPRALRADEPPADSTQQKQEQKSTEEQDGEDQAKQAGAHFKIGTDAIKLKQWDNAISELEQAVKISPENSAYHHALGIAYMGSKQANAGWYHFRQAVRLDPANVVATVDFMKTWKLLDAQGLFNVGNPLKKVVQTLGKPDQAVDRGARLRLVYGFMSLNFINERLFSILDMRNLPPKGLSTTDGMAFTLAEKEWVVAYRILAANQGNTEYVRRGETIQSWTELFSSQRFIDAARNKTAADVMKGIQQRLESRFSNVAFKVLDESDKDVLFTWSIEQTDEHAAQQEVVRLVQGEHDIHRLAYTRKGAFEEETDTQAFWIKKLKQAKLLSAKELRAYHEKQQRIIQETELRDVSRQILAKQIELIRKKEIEDLKLFFTEDARKRITQELLEKVIPFLDKLSPEEMVDHVTIESEGQSVKATIFDKQAEPFTILIQIKGRWFAETIWFEALVK